MERQVLTVVEAGQVLGLSRSGAYLAAARGDIPTIRIGRKKLLVPKKALERLLEGKRVATEGMEPTVAEEAKGDVRTTWLVTGNNPTFSREIARRVVRIRINAQMERPWLRSGFRHADLSTWTLKECPRLLWAVLTSARAWVVAGRPPGTETMGSFESWAVILGGILAVADVPDFLANREVVYLRAETEREAWLELLSAWWNSYQEQRVGVGQLFDLAAQHKLLSDLRAG